MTSIDDLLAGGGAAGKGLKFEAMGTSYSGPVVSVEIRPYTDLKTGKPEFWDNDPNQPKQQIVIGIQTNQYDPTIENDDGVRYDYIKAWGVQKKALQAASKLAGGSPAVGDIYSVTFVSQEASTTRGFNPTKIYEYAIRKANPLDATLNAGAPVAAPQAAPVQQAYQAPVAQQAYQAPVAQQAAPVAQQVAAPVATPGGGALTPQQEDQVRLFIEKSLTDEQIAAVTEGVTAADAHAVRLQVAAGTGGGF